MIITREYLLNLLEDWQQNKITASDLYKTASELYFPGSLEFIDWEGDDDSSVTNEVLQYLDCLNINFVTQEDIEPCKEFLRTKIGHFDEGLKKWQEYIATIDHAERMKKLKGQYPYI